MGRRWKAILRWSDDRIRRAQLLDELDEISSRYEEPLKASGRPGADAYEKLLAQMFGEIDPFRDELEIIETRQRIRTAHRWGVPVPLRPHGTKGDDNWERSPWGQWVLTDEGHKRLRRETAIEVEIFAKPWLSWGAVAISVVSLVVAAFK